MKRTILILALTLLTALTFADSNTRGESTGTATSKGIFENALFSDIDSVNPFNGNLSVNLPIGQTYSVGPTLSLQLSLFYNLSLWTDIDINTHVLQYSTQICELLPLSRFAVSGRDTYGAGWDIHLGYISQTLINPTRNGTYQYNAPDGSSHALYPSLYNSDIYLTHDGSFLKLTHHTTPSEYFEMEDGSGTVYTFGHHVAYYSDSIAARHCDTEIDFQYNRNGFYLTEIADPWGNRIEATYLTSSGANIDRIDSVTLRDSKNLNIRTITFHYTTIQNSMDYDWCDPKDNCQTVSQTYTYEVLSRIDLPTVGGATLSYNFQVENKLITRPDRYPGTLSCWEIGTPDPCTVQLFPVQETFYVPMLTSVSTDDGGGITYAYAFDYYYDAIPDLTECSGVLNQQNDEVGTLASIILPTGGRLNYTYKRILRQNGPGLCPTNGEPREETPPLISLGVETREYFTSDNTQIGTYVYDLCGFDSGAAHFANDEISTSVTVIDDLSGQVLEETKFTYDYQKVNASETTYGTDTCKGQYPLHGSLLRQENLDGSGDPAQIVEYEYEYDDQTAIEDCHETNTCASTTLLSGIVPYSKNHNIRTSRIVTRFARSSGGEDVTTVLNEEWDNAGHFERTKFFDGEVPAGSGSTPLRETYTDYTADTINWILNQKSESWVKDQYGNHISYTKYHYTSSGSHLGDHYLNATCQYESEYGTNLDQTCAATYNVMSMTYEVPAKSIMSYFPDTQSTEAPDGLPNEEHYLYASARIDGAVDPDFKITSTYQYSLLTACQFYGKRLSSWLPIGGFLTKVVRDKTTGLVTKSYDETGGYFTTTAFNKLGMPTSVTPSGEAAIHLSYQLDPANGMTVQTRRGLSTNPLQSEVLSDNFGRIKEERKYKPGNLYTKKIQQYDILGRSTFASTWLQPGIFPTTSWIPGPTLSGTSITYDHLGRVITTQKTGDAYPMSVSYKGTRIKTVSNYVQSSLTTQSESLTHYTYDALGNLLQVQDPLGAITNYTYNGQGNLTLVNQNSADLQTNQLRTFTYDLLGRMTSETHPEGKEITYQTFNALGNVTQYRTEQEYLGTSFPYYFTNTYDFTGRLTKSEVSTQGYRTGDACTPSYNCYPLRELTYDDPIIDITAADGSPIQESLTVGNTTTVRGKLTMAKEYQIFDGNRSGFLSTGPCNVALSSLTDVYYYDSPGIGRITGRRLYSEAFTHGDTLPQTDRLYFSWGYNYDSNGNLASILYPEAYDVASQQSLGFVKDENDLPLNRTATYAYDTDHPAYLTGLSRPGASPEILDEISYDSHGLLQTIFYGSGLSGLNYFYDPLNRPKDIYGFSGNGFVFKEIAMTYDSSGNLTYFHNAIIKPIDPGDPIEIDPVPIPWKCLPKWRNYYASYDPASRVKFYKKETEFYDWPGCDLQFNATSRIWSYDDYGNILNYQTRSSRSLLSAIVDLPVDASTNQLIGPDYDGRGNLIRGEPVDDDGSDTTPDRRIHFYQYSPENKMTMYFEDVLEGGPNLQDKMVEHLFAYNWQGERTVSLKRSVVESVCADPVACWCVEPDTTEVGAWSLDTIFIRDEAGRVLAEFDRSTEELSVPTRATQLNTYTWYRYNYYGFGRMVAADGILDDMDADGVPEALGRRYYYHDHLGSVRAVTDGYEQFLMAYDYWPYGEEMYSSQWNEDSYRYTGHERDYDLGLDYMHARHYSPGTGRFMSADTINGSIYQPQTFNLYGYTAGNPVNYIDPYGMAPQSPTSSNSTNGDTGGNVTSEQCNATPNCKWKSDGCYCIHSNGEEVKVDDIVELYAAATKIPLPKARDTIWDPDSWEYSISPEYGGKIDMGPLRNKERTFHPVLGCGASIVPFVGGEGSIGIVADTARKWSGFGLFASGGYGTGVNVSGDIFTGFVYGNSISGGSENFNITLLSMISVTLMVSEESIGITAGFGPSLPYMQYSRTYAGTKAVHIYDLSK